MNTLRVVWCAIKRTVDKPTHLIATVLIVAVPLLYPLMWLQAFWNPYANVDKLPVAFVNQDAGQFGSQLERQLKASDAVDWQFTDKTTADAGLRDKTYYGEIVIPGDFSAAIAAAQPGGIDVYVDSKNNSTATLLVTQVQNDLTASLSKTIATSTLATALPNQTVLAQFITEPVTATQTDIDPVADMATGFAPYFASLALWIGALLMSMGFRNRVAKAAPEGTSAASLAFGRYLFYALVGIVQSGLLTGVLVAMGIQVRHGLVTFACLAVSSLTSIALVSLLVSLFGTAGQLLAMIVLILQLTTAGGTYPVQLTQGGFFQAVHPYVPFTYSINALREAVSALSVDVGTVLSSVGIQLGVAVVAVVLCVVGVRWKARRAARRQL